MIYNIIVLGLCKNFLFMTVRREFSTVNVSYNKFYLDYLERL